MDVFELALGGFANLKIAAENIEPTAPMASTYARLINYLSSTHEVIPFAYDWRKSIREAAQRFGDVIAKKLKETDQPIRIVAHSMGGLVARAMFAECDDVWDDFVERKGSRLLLLGTPHKGAYVIPQMLMGKERTLQLLELLDLRHSKQNLLQWIVQFPGVLELLPTEDDQVDYFSTQVWHDFSNLSGGDLIIPKEDDLENAKKFSEVLERSPVDPEKMAYIAGWAPNTPCGIRTKNDRGNIDLHFIGTDEGDGRVPWNTGIPEGLPAWYMEAAHGDLPDHKPGFPAIYELLVDGQTQRLPQIPQHISRAGQREYRLADDQPLVFPDQTDLEQAVMCSAPTRLLGPKVEPIHVSVAHGNLAFCEDPIAVGHYEGDALVSAEKALDYYLDRRLTTHHELGIYPGELGTALVVINTEKKPGGAIVVGLGKIGELSPKKLTDTFVTALTKYAVQRIEDHPGGGQLEIEFISLLVGTGEGGLSISNSIFAILESVHLVNKSLAQMPSSNNARITKLQFIELYKDRAIQATRELMLYPDREKFQIETEVQNLSGGRHRAYFQESPGWWNRMHIRSKGRGNSLMFTLPTNRARTEESELQVQWRNTDKLIQQAVNNPHWNWRLATTMFELLLPNRVKAFVSDLSNIVLVVDQTSARYPWELIYDRRMGDQKPMVIEVGLIRQLATQVFRTQVMDASNQNVMVVGNPKNTPKEFVDLPGAEQEARIVSNLLANDNFTVQSQIGTATVDIMTELFSADYRILHLAGHGVFEHELSEDADKEGENDKITGMVLGGGVFLTANEVNQMTRVPELVFINCCFLGKINPDDEAREAQQDAMRFPRHEFAASLSQRLIEMGVKAVVAAGWAVDDAAAVTFAETFYRNMLEGGLFGEAVKQARAVTYELHHDRTNTWGAYQCYGDPMYKLVKFSRTSSGEKTQRFVDLEEVIVEVENLIEDAKTTSVQGLENLRGWLKDILKEIEDTNKSWLNDAKLNEVLGRAYREMDLFKEAVIHYGATLENRKGRATINAAEQQANLRARWAVEVYRQGSPDEARALITESLDQLERLVKTFGENLERLSLIGSAHKRQAQISTGENRQIALENMKENYQAAWEKDKDNPYPLGNMLTAQVVLFWVGVKQRRSDILYANFKKLKALTTQQTIDNPHDFWAAIGETDTYLLKGLLEGSLVGIKDDDEKAVDLAKRYTTAWQRYGTARELKSVSEHLDFLVTMFETHDFEFKHDSENRIKQRANLYIELSSLAKSLREMIRKKD